VFTVLFEPRDRVTLTRYSGLLSPEDLATLDNFVAAFVAREGYVRSIFDFTDVETFAIPRSRLVERGRKPRMNPGQDRVFVTPQQEIRELYRDYAQVQRDFGNGEMMVVQTMAEALLLLGLHNPDFQHLWRPTSPAGSFLPPG
jgi:hypothetical protein